MTGSISDPSSRRNVLQHLIVQSPTPARAMANFFASLAQLGLLLLATILDAWLLGSVARGEAPETGLAGLPFEA